MPRVLLRSQHAGAKKSHRDLSFGGQSPPARKAPGAELTQPRSAEVQEGVRSRGYSSSPVTRVDTSKDRVHTSPDSSGVLPSLLLVHRRSDVSKETGKGGRSCFHPPINPYSTDPFQSTGTHSSGRRKGQCSFAVT